MASEVRVSKLASKSHDNPDEVRTPDKTRVEVVRLEGYTLGRFTFQPGWRWSECVKPVVKTDSCPSEPCWIHCLRPHHHQNDGRVSKDHGERRVLCDPTRS
jgi:hypothetical protein